MVKLPDPFEKFSISHADYDGNENHGRFVMEPLSRGFGHTIGNALRRVLLSSLPGGSIYAVEINGARHEFSALDGVEEDVASIILNLKDLILKFDNYNDESKRLVIDVVGPHVVTGKDIVCPTGVSVVNPDVVLAHVVDGGHLQVTIKSYTHIYQLGLLLLIAITLQSSKLLTLLNPLVLVMIHVLIA